MAENITTLSESTFDEEIGAASEPVLVDFWAEWCGPCRTIAPVLEEIAAERSGSLRIAKVDVDQNPKLAERFAVQSIPTMLLFDGGKVTDLRLIGALPKARLEQELSPYLKASK